MTQPFPVIRHLGCFQSLTITNNADKHLWYTPFPAFLIISLSYIPLNEITVSNMHTFAFKAFGTQENSCLSKPVTSWVKEELVGPSPDANATFGPTFLPGVSSPSAHLSTQAQLGLPVLTGCCDRYRTSKGKTAASREKVRRGTEMLAFTKRFSSKGLKGFQRYGLINLHKSVIFLSDTDPNRHCICWCVFVHSLCSCFLDIP